MFGDYEYNSYHFNIYSSRYNCLMQAPQTPIDIKIEMGSDQNNQNLLNVEVDFTDNAEYVSQFLQEKKLPQDFGKQLVLMFDLFVEQGRENDAMEYFKSDKGKAPLQILFSIQPDEENNKIKFELEKHEGFIRLYYKFTFSQDSSGLAYSNEIFDAFKTYQVQLQSHLSWTIRGNISHNNKNRTNVLVDYSKFQFVSNAFCSEKFLNCISTFDEILNNCQYYLSHPIFNLIKKSKVAKLHLKTAQFRKVSKFYQQVSHMEKEPKEKSSKYTNQGIFREKADAVLIFNSQYMIKANGKYGSQDAFQRLLKVYARFFERLFKINFYHEDD